MKRCMLVIAFNPSDPFIQLLQDPSATHADRQYAVAKELLDDQAPGKLIDIVTADYDDAKIAAMVEEHKCTREVVIADLDDELRQHLHVQGLGDLTRKQITAAASRAPASPLAQ